MDEETFIDAHGVEIFYRRWPRADAKGVVVIAHGACEHSGRYDRFARELNDHGYAAYAIDHRGHGRTGASSGVGRMGPGGGAAVLDDLGELIQRARAEVPGVPVVLFGHSMGSFFTQSYVAHRGGGLAAYVLCGWPGALTGLDEARALFDGAVQAGMGDDPIESLGPFNEPFEPGARTPFEWLSRDPAEVDLYIEDPFCGVGNPLTYGYLNELFSVLAPAVEPSAIEAGPRIPVLFIAGDMDPAGEMGAHPRALEKRLRDAGLDTTAHYYPEARHELLNETNRDEVHADVIAWLDRVVAAT